MSFELIDFGSRWDIIVCIDFKCYSPTVIWNEVDIHVSLPKFFAVDMFAILCIFNHWNIVKFMFWRIFAFAYAIVFI